MSETHPDIFTDGEAARNGCQGQPGNNGAAGARPDTLAHAPARLAPFGLENPGALEITLSIVRVKKPEVHPDIFTDTEAAEYMRLPSEKTLEWCMAEHGLDAFKVGRERRFCRRDLDQCVASMFGDLTGKRQKLSDSKGVGR